MKNSKLFLIALMTVFAFISCDDDMMVDPNVDLTVTEIQVTSDDIDSDNNDFSGNITITGIIKNIGTDDFISGANQQIAQINEMISGIGDPTTIATLSFDNVPAGESVEVSVTIPWSLTIEFPSSFSVDLSYDPDIFIDGNLNNDDDNLTNNSAMITGFEIHDLF